MRFLIAGSSGFLGTALRVRLAEQGHEVVRLVRRAPASALESRWDPDSGQLDPGVLAGVDVVVNLGGAGVADRPWTTARRALILFSRLNTTGTLARALAERAKDSGPATTLIQASGISRYGTVSGAQPFQENSPAGTDYLSQVVVEWEAAAQPAVAAGVRTVFLRTAPVMHASGGPLQIMRVPWSLGLGAQLGDGQQRMPMVGLEDYLRTVLWAAGNPAAAGAYNVTIPQTTTNAEFTKTLATVLGRPVRLRAPGFAFRAALGELAQQLLGDMYVVPSRLTAAGFTFVDPDVESTLRRALGRRLRA
jgi:uncharacterized protein (TIGR01777 family)